MKHKKIFIAFSAFIIYFSFGIATLNNYGISWDEPTHFKRGQAYLWYFLTGKTTYEGLPEYNLDQAKINPYYHERSLYQNENQNMQYHLNNDGDHPPLNGILSAFFNYVFYQKLGILGDIQSYHFFEIFISAILVGVVVLFAFESFSFWVAIFSAIFLATYPLFWAESHFNIKDPIETTFFTLAAYTFYKGFVLKSYKWFLVSALVAGLAFSTKLNIVFLPFILVVWLFLVLTIYKENIFKTLLEKKILLVLILYPLIVFSIFMITWPYIWQDIIGNTIKVFGYYKEIGLEDNLVPSRLLDYLNIYALKWIIFTTQPFMLISFIFGILSFRFLKKDQKILFWLWMIWFSVTILRVSVPGASIYGGVRQIMEYIPVMALISGIGADYIRENLWLLLKGKINLRMYNLIFLIFVVLGMAFVLIKLHPNENVYFNSLSGGLKKNMDGGLLGAGNSFGNAYLQGIHWLNKNTQLGVKVALIQGTNQNIPAYYPRQDIQFSNYHWSGIKREGEYLMELTHIYNVRVYHYAWEYVEKMLDPVYEVKIDGAPILKIWKNDIEHTKREYQLNEIEYLGRMHVEKTGINLNIDLRDKLLLSRLILYYQPNNDCKPLKTGYIETSIDNKNWRREGDQLPFDQLGRRNEIEKNSLRYMFAARDARYIRIISDDVNSCILINPIVKLIILD